MSIDYDQLREWLDTIDQANPLPGDTIEFTYPGSTVEIVRELLRLRRELTDVRNLMKTHAWYLGRDGLRAASEYIDDYANRLTRVLEGGNE